MAWSESFGEFGPVRSPLSGHAFDEIALLPSGSVGLTGLRVENLFFARPWKLGVDYQGGARHEYKTALNMFHGARFSADAPGGERPHRGNPHRAVGGGDQQRP